MSRKGRERAVVEENLRFAGAKGAVGLPWERSDAKENGEVERRRRQRERFCGDSVCASGWQTF
eukprot:4869775-Pleurochrysis_carterae.AAC.1